MLASAGEYIKQYNSAMAREEVDKLGGDKGEV